MHLDVPLSNGEIVSINLLEELPPNPQELITFLSSEAIPRKYWIILARAYVDLNKTHAAETIIQHAVQNKHFDGSDQDALLQFLVWLDLYHAQDGRERDQRLAKASQAMAQLSGGTGTILAQAVYQLLSGHQDKAGDIFDKLLRIDPHNCFAMLGKAQVVVKKTRNYSAALKLYQQVLVLNPEMQPDPRIGIGMCLWMLKDREMAVAAWTRADEVKPSREAKVLLLLAKLHQTMTESASDDEFIESYTECMRSVKEMRDGSDNKVSSVELIVASHLFARGELERVEQVLDGIEGNGLSLGPSLQSQISTWRGRIAFSRGDYTGAAKAFQGAIKLDEGNVVAQLGLGQAQVLRGSVEEAIMTFESVVRAHPTCAEAQYSLGRVYAQSRSRRKQDAAVAVLERYVKLCGKEPVATNAHLLLSLLNEKKDTGQALACLQKINEPSQEALNNMGVFYFMKEQYDKAKECWERDNKEKDDSVTLLYNLARVTELSDKETSVQMYKSLVAAHPSYISARLRLIFLSLVDTPSQETLESVKEQMDQLLGSHGANLEVRSFYGWFVRNFGRRVGLRPDVDTAHQKETLVAYDSHEAYALVSLGNIYCAMARECKRSDEKRPKYYVRAAELFVKVLSRDPHNAYAAQGLAIVYIENGHAHAGWDILRKVRDSLRDVSVYLNLGHVLCDLHQYAKAAESYDLALRRFTDGNDPRVLGFLARAWLLRGTAENSLPHLELALTHARAAEKAAGSKGAYLFNVAYVQFQIAELVSRQPLHARTEDAIVRASDALREGMATLAALANDPHPPYPPADLHARAALGDTLLARLDTCLEESRAHAASVSSRLDEAMRLREKENEERLRQEEARRAAEKAREDELAAQRALLQAQAREWAEERDEEEEKPKKRKRDKEREDGESEEEEEKEEKEEKEKEKKGGKRRRKAKSREVIEDSDEELEE